MSLTNLKTFLKSVDTGFVADVLSADINILFQNSQRGNKPPKSFSISFGSLIQTLQDILNNISEFTNIEDYEEKIWRDKGAEYYTDPIVNAQCTVQTKPLFTLISKLIFWANELSSKGKVYSDSKMYITNEYLEVAIDKLSNMNVPFDQLYHSSIDSNNASSSKEFLGFNLILYGAPGSGKNHFLESQIDLSKSIKTTFHPDSDYSTFVGSFKPLMIEDQITYSFVPQSFTNAYVNAWKDLNTPYYLVIDEINRANCSQVFGDIFQLLDRKHNGYSEYTINVDKDLANYLKETLTGTDYLDKLKSGYPSESIGDDYSRIALPCNLYIYATMNTSDQSLFPMDSAFKRRWEWRYIPINYKDAETLTIEIGDQKYSWRTFLEKVNPIILELKDSDDKQMGNRFVNPIKGIISLGLFRSKVLFYLWSEIFKDEQDSPLNIFKRISEDTTSNLRFKDFFPEDDNMSADIINDFMNANGIEPKQ